ncbi:hypothetical protein CRE_00596 [Caenorhabditis remanei]|uniref:Uncharacterized protein n=1 Tax=Caenorhabditis remanei TaxID=31234 RepID=E3LDC2_CAERE|nr:hypothetical protein CRE_00596 [Caenorhabditis remanei]
MKFKVFGTLFLLIQFVAAAVTQEELEINGEAKQTGIVVDQIRLKRQQNGYGMWNNGGGEGGNFPMGNWNGPNSNGFGGPQPPPPDDTIKGSIGTKEEKPTEENSKNGQINGEGQEPWWPNGNSPSGYNGPQPGGNFPNGNGYNNGPNPFNGGIVNSNVDDGIKGSVGAATEPTKSPNQRNGYGYGNRGGNGYGNNFGFNRMAGGGGYGNNFGRPILPRGERFFRGGPRMRY